MLNDEDDEQGVTFETYLAVISSRSSMNLNSLLACVFLVGVDFQIFQPNINIINLTYLGRSIAAMVRAPLFLTL